MRGALKLEIDKIEGVSSTPGPRNGGGGFKAQARITPGLKRVHGLFGRANKETQMKGKVDQKGDKRNLNTVEASGPVNLYDIGSLRVFIGCAPQANVAAPQKRWNMQYRGSPTEKNTLVIYIGIGYKQALQCVYNIPQGWKEMLEKMARTVYPQQVNVAAPQNRSNMKYRGSPTE